MSSLVKLCPKCNKHITFEINNDLISLNCQCGDILIIELISLS